MTKQTKQTQPIEVTVRCRPFGGVLVSAQCKVEPDGTVRVFDGIAGYFTRIHSLSEQEIGRIKAAAKRAA